MLSTSYLVMREASPVVLRVQGRASFDNCGPVRNFFADRRRRGEKEFIVDLKDCRGMDSTFLGILAGLANETSPLGGKVILTRPDSTLLSVIHNLGLDRLLTIAINFAEPASSGNAQTLQNETQTEIEQARMVLEAHENIIAANPATRANFMDVIEFLKERLGAHA